jgi:hypothetical protein
MMKNQNKFLRYAKRRQVIKKNEIAQLLKIEKEVPEYNFNSPLTTRICLNRQHQTNKAVHIIIFQNLSGINF